MPGASAVAESLALALALPLAMTLAAAFGRTETATTRTALGVPIAGTPAPAVGRTETLAAAITGAIDGAGAASLLELLEPGLFLGRERPLGLLFAQRRQVLVAGGALGRALFRAEVAAIAGGVSPRAGRVGTVLGLEGEGGAAEKQGRQTEPGDGWTFHSVPIKTVVVSTFFRDRRTPVRRSIHDRVWPDERRPRARMTLLSSADDNAGIDLVLGAVVGEEEEGVLVSAGVGVGPDLGTDDGFALAPLASVAV